MPELTPLEMLSNNYSFYMKQMQDKKEEKERQKEKVKDIQNNILGFIAEINHKVQISNNCEDIKKENLFLVKRLNIFEFLQEYYEFILHFKDHFEANHYYPSAYTINRNHNTVTDILKLYLNNDVSDKKLKLFQKTLDTQIEYQNYLFLSVQNGTKNVLGKEQEISYVFYHYLSQIDNKIYQYFLSNDVNKITEFTDMTITFKTYNKLFHENKYVVNDDKLLYIVFSNKWGELNKFLKYLVSI